MNKKESTLTTQISNQKSVFMDVWAPRILWGVAVLMICLLVFIFFWQPSPANSSTSITVPSGINSTGIVISSLLPDIQNFSETPTIRRYTNAHTILPAESRVEAIQYKVAKGDSVFGIANKYKISPDTLLWSNYETLNDNPDMLSPDQQLWIPPTDGVYYKWAEGDTIESIAARFKVEPEAILEWSANQLDLTNPEVEVDNFIMIPGGKSTYKQWLVPTIPRGRAGVITHILGPGSCDTGEGGAFGTGAFVWPADNHYLSGNDYFAGHQAIDIAAGEGAAIYAADSGLVVYAGAISGGYGNMIMIDHGNGYQTLYAHLSSINTNCGNSVLQGQFIGRAGNTGYSFGAHLHFEVRYLGGFINPWYVLP